jgi:hypothetical protein
MNGTLLAIDDSIVGMSVTTLAPTSAPTLMTSSAIPAAAGEAEFFYLFRVSYAWYTFAGEVT